MACLESPQISYLPWISGQSSGEMARAMLWGLQTLWGLSHSCWFYKITMHTQNRRWSQCCYIIWPWLLSQLCCYETMPWLLTGTHQSYATFSHTL